MAVERHFTGTRFEPAVGFCRAVRVGSRVLVSGSLGLTAEGTPARGGYAAAGGALERIAGAIEALGGTRADVVRTRMFAISPTADFDEIARAHSSFFGEHPPASTL